MRKCGDFNTVLIHFSKLVITLGEYKWNLFILETVKNWCESTDVLTKEDIVQYSPLKRLLSKKGMLTFTFIFYLVV